MLLEQLFSGLMMGSFYALIALGFVLVFKATDVFNFAQGELMMLGPFIAVALITNLKLPLVLGIIGAILIVALIGFLMDRLVMGSMVGQSLLAVVLATMAFSIVLRSIAAMVWGHELIGFPDIFSNIPYRVAGVAMSPSQLWVIGICLGLVVLSFLFFQYTNMGVAFRAASENQLGSVYVGISVRNVFTQSWVLAAAVGAIGGILIAPITMLQVGMGHMALTAFPAAVLGGMKSIPGAIVGGIILGVLESLAGAYLPEWVRNIFPWAALIIILLIKPEGIFGVHKRKKV
ncbi:branched-chain amino acid ABC transporter permease [Thermodesulfobacteriota bacterium]